MGAVVDMDSARGKGPQPTLEGLQRLTASDINSVNTLILRHMQSEVALIPELAGHIIAAGGKRLRPALALWIAPWAIWRSTAPISTTACVTLSTSGP